MFTDNEILKLILGFKVRYLRQSLHLSYQELSTITGLSTSYLNDIEKGKKYPKPGKIQLLAKALKVKYDDMVSTSTTKKMQPVLDLLSSDFFKYFPLSEFGISPEKLLDVFTNSAEKTNAFISTIIKMIRNYQIEKEHFYRIALRSYQDMHYNYFEEIENAADLFKKENNLISKSFFTTKILEKLLNTRYNIKIDRNSLQKMKKLSQLRSYYSPAKKMLYINKGLKEAQENFLIARELGFQYLQFNERPYETLLNKEASFEKLLNNFKSSYFSVALLLGQATLITEIEKMSRTSHWNTKIILDLINKYKLTPEMLLQRLTNILPHHFGIKDLFFLRLESTEDLRSYKMTKELHLSQLHAPYNNELNEHFCHRWVSVNVLKKRRTQKHIGNTKNYEIDAQISKYWESPNAYFCISIGQDNSFGKSAPSSVTLGLLINPKLQATFNFLKDPKIITREVNTTCERCSMPDCDNRVAPPTFIESANYQLQMEDQLARLEVE